MKKIILALIIFLVPHFLLAQEEFWVNPPDYTKIEKSVTSKKSPQYYPKLVKKFANCDTTLVPEDVVALYYGQAYQKGFSALGHLVLGLDTIRNMLRGDTLTPGDVKKIVDLANEEISEAPADPRLYYYKFIAQNYSVKMHGADSNEATKSYIQFMALTNTIVNSGDGKSMNHAMHVINVSDEYFIMNMIGVDPKSQHLIFDEGHYYDMFLLDTNDLALDTLWFNIDIHFSMLNKTFSDNNPKTEKKKTLTTVDIPLNNYFDIELVKVKNGKSKFRVISMEPFDETIVFDSVLNDSIPKNHIIGYFGNIQWSSLGGESTNLIFKSNFDGEPLSFNTEIQNAATGKFHTTSNSGIFSGVKMNEIWHENISAIRISNIRREK